VFNVLSVGYSLAKNNLNNTYQYNYILNYINKIQSESFLGQYIIMYLQISDSPLFFT
jgi:hypothetical protein